MKHTLLTLLCFASISSISGMIGVPAATSDAHSDSIEKEPALTAHDIFGHTLNLGDSLPDFIEFDESLVTVTVGSQAPQLSQGEWQAELKKTIQNTKSNKLISLLSPEGQPTANRSLNFNPYADALQQITNHKEEEQRILDNVSNPNAKCFKCCNSAYIWNRYLAPSIIILIKCGQLGFAGWGIWRATNQVLSQAPDYYQAASNAAPAIASLLAAIGDTPFSLINARERFELKEHRDRHEYYVLAESNVKAYEELVRLARESNAGIQQLLANTEYKNAAHQDHSNNDSVA